MNIQGLDLNLLLVFHFLVEEKSVTKAAEKLNLSQPAVSNALARIREIIGDPILIRSGRNLVLSTYAKEQKQSLKELVDKIEGVFLKRGAFDPNICTRRFVVACADVIEVTLLASLLPIFTKKMPQASLKIVTLGELYRQNSLETGDVDLMIGFPPKVLEDSKIEELYRDEFVCVSGRKLFRNRTVSMNDFLSVPHIRITPISQTYDMVDLALEKQNLKRKVILSAPHFSSVPFFLRKIDAIAVLPSRLVEQAGRSLNVYKLAFKLPPILVSQMWHDKTDNDEANIFLRQLVAAASKVPS
jgi:LysR family transcriptional regulator, mexEF-oprN operon transcriptional activator